MFRLRLDGDSDAGGSQAVTGNRLRPLRLYPDLSETLPSVPTAEPGDVDEDEDEEEEQLAATADEQRRQRQEREHGWVAQANRVMDAFESAERERGAATSAVS